jgi:hypothetical protein
VILLLNSKVNVGPVMFVRVVFDNTLPLSLLPRSSLLLSDGVLQPGIINS